MEKRTCRHCEADISGKRPQARYCGKKCRGADRPNGGHRVTGTATCAECGDTFETVRGRNTYCGRVCSDKNSGQWERTPAQPLTLTPVPWACCTHCHGWFVARAGRTHCQATECVRTRKREYMRQYMRGRPEAAEQVMALYYLATDNLEIPKASMWRQQLVAYLRTRDGDTCPLCTRPIDFAAKSGPCGSDRGSSIDHIIPRSQDGPDTLANLRLTCWGCNRDRGNRGGNEQLALIG